MRQRALITGVTGSGGSYLAEHLVRSHPEVEVHGLSRWHSTTATDNLEQVAEQVHVHECDLNDFGATFRLLDTLRPDLIFHLASHANVAASFTTPLAVLTNNVGGTAVLLEAIRTSGLRPLVQICSSSEVYGLVAADDLPITEDTPMRPASPYAVSKCTQDLLGATYFAAYGMRIIRTRMFSYVNPRRSDLFASSFARQIARIEAGQSKELRHGNLESVRTLVDVRDAMEAYWLVMQRGRLGEAYNIAGTTTATVGEVLDQLRAMARCPVPVRPDPDLLRPVDVTLQVPSVDKLRRETGWQPQYSLDDSLAHLLDYWRNRVALRCAAEIGTEDPDG